MLDLDAIIAVADGYEARKQAMIEAGALKDPAYLATLADGEAIKAFEFLRPLVERVRELEELSDRAIDEAGCLLGCMPTLDCRVCDYHDYCPKPMPGYEPDTETCRAAMRRFCDPNFKLEKMSDRKS